MPKKYARARSNTRKPTTTTKIPIKSIEMLNFADSTKFSQNIQIHTILYLKQTQ